MKLQWKLVIGLVIGMLMVGQVASIRYALSAGNELNLAKEELKAAKDSMEVAGRDYKELITSWTAMNKMPQTPMEKEMMGLSKQSAAVQKAIWDANSHALAAMEKILKNASERK